MRQHARGGNRRPSRRRSVAAGRTVGVGSIAHRVGLTEARSGARVRLRSGVEEPTLQTGSNSSKAGRSTRADRRSRPRLALDRTPRSPARRGGSGRCRGLRGSADRGRGVGRRARATSTTSARTWAKAVSGRRRGRSDLEAWPAAGGGAADYVTPLEGTNDFFAWPWSEDATVARPSIAWRRRSRPPA
ncbi:MAG: hypothetical protein MZV70_45385 [Desulfobacterales bacterium]|nr:hypothetical protein [Desulfobacterales bacterium]